MISYQEIRHVLYIINPQSLLYHVSGALMEYILEFPSPILLRIEEVEESVLERKDLDDSGS